MTATLAAERRNNLRRLIAELARRCVAPVSGRRGDRAAREAEFRSARRTLEMKLSGPGRPGSPGRTTPVHRRLQWFLRCAA
ncbi:MAG: hypothetical protein KIT68_05580 [Phycisphaeraceae bacterium]|nr:hypothetical protein [Phycisphaeraceae bacterium]